MSALRGLKSICSSLAAIAALTVLVPTQAAAQTADPSPSPTISLGNSTVFVNADGTVTATFSSTGLKTDDLIQWRVHERLGNSEQNDVSSSVDAAIDAADQNPLDAFGDQISETSEVLAGFLLKADGSFTISVKLGDPATTPGTTKVDQPGIYPLVVSIARSDETVASAYTLVTRLPTSGVPMQVFSVANGPVELSTLPDGKISFSEDTARKLRTLVEQLELDDDGLLAVGLRGETVNALFASEERAMNDLGRRLRSTMGDHTLLRQPFSYLHLGAWAAQTENPDLAISLATSSATVEEKLGELPSPAIAPPDPSMSNQSAAVLTVTGTKAILLDPAAVPVPPETPLGLRTGATAPLTNGSSLPAFWVDADLSAALPQTGSRREVQNFLAIAAAAAFDARAAVPDTEGRLAILEVPASVPAAALSDVLSAISEGGNLLAADKIDELPSFVVSETVGAKASLIDTPATILGTFPQDTNRARQLLNAYRNTVDDLDLDARATDQLLLLSTTLGIDTQARDAYIDTVKSRARSWLSDITFESPGPITITSQEAEIPLRFINRSDFPATVELRFDSNRVELVNPAPANPEVQVPMGESTVRVKVRMQSSGQFAIPLVVRSPDGTELITTGRLTIRSAAFSGVGVALSIASLLVLAAWWIRTHRRNKRQAETSTTHGSITEQQ